MAALKVDTPDSDEIEISVLGQGFGESIVVHIGDGKWLIIDSFRNSEFSDPAPLEYLKRIGVNPSTDILLVVATHWHNDHIGGMADIISEASSANFACAATYKEGLFEGLFRLARSSKSNKKGGTGADEINRITDILNQRKLDPILTQSRTVLLRYSDVEVTAVSPSPRCMASSIQSIMEKLRREPIRKGARIPNLGANDTSIVLSLKIGNHNLLLGGDLETKVDRRLGWGSVVDIAQALDLAQHDIFKIPHHGSANGQCEETRKKLLNSWAPACVTPFRHGRTTLPTTELATEISKKYERSFIAGGEASEHSYSTSDLTINKRVNASALKTVELRPKFGLVRFRKKQGASTSSGWRINLFENSRKLVDYAKAQSRFDRRKS